jgi:putative drug exporter of the RND superfamily
MIAIYKKLVARFITQYWIWVILFWVGLAVGLRSIAPSWESIAQDGDLQFLPADLPSRVGQQLLEEGFPKHRARSQLVIVFAREEKSLQQLDLAIGLDVGRRLMYVTAVAAYRRNQIQSTEGIRLVGDRERDEENLKLVLAMFDEAVSLDQQWYDATRAAIPAEQPLPADRLALLFWDRSQVQTELGLEDLARSDRDTALLLDPGIAQLKPMQQRTDFEWDHVLDLWTWNDDLLGSKLGSKNPRAKMLVMQLNSDFIATSNIPLLENTEGLITNVKELYKPWDKEQGLEIGVTGSAAVGGDMLRASAQAVQQTEWVTVALILVILAVIYRGPLLVAIPLMTIGLSLIVAMSLVALLADGPDEHSWLGLHVFTTTRIFVVVLLFGAGTDFCLFFLARCREVLQLSPYASRRNVQRMVASSWCSVHDALVLSALTTIIGLGLMFFSKFEKFRNTGPIIGLSLAVTIVVCLTFTPAVICGLGHIAFWPALAKRRPRQGDSIVNDSLANGDDFDINRQLKNSAPSTELPASFTLRFWTDVAQFVVTKPVRTLLVCLIVLAIPAIQGWVHRDWVTYDFARELNENAPSRQGSLLVAKHFQSSDNSPLTVVMNGKESFASDKEIRQAIEKLRGKLYVEGVVSVRSLTDPLGDFPPERRMGLFAQDSWRRRLLEGHSLTQQFYVSSNPSMDLRVARLDLLISPNPFSIEAEEVLARVERILQSEVADPESLWFESEFAFAGTTPGIHDLKMVTQADQQRIQILVTLGVWIVLLVMLRRIWISGYLIFTVLLSYLTTVGLSQWFFQWAYGDDFVGLDWKVPLFLFVILVAVGQDYNVYLTTRVIEEQERHGPIKGLKRALILTGGIITSCGIVMAGTFLSMTSGAVGQWLSQTGLPIFQSANDSTPVLRGIVELGFALALGVLIDTFLVRSILVPAMFAIQTRFAKKI